jgi:hypothetical protein
LFLDLKYFTINKRTKGKIYLDIKFGHIKNKKLFECIINKKEKMKGNILVLENSLASKKHPNPPKSSDKIINKL